MSEVHAATQGDDNLAFEKALALRPKHVEVYSLLRELKELVTKKLNGKTLSIS